MTNALAGSYAKEQKKRKGPIHPNQGRRSLFCLLMLLFGGVLHNVAVVVFLSSLMSL